MVVVKLMGGLGNQMFQYAFGKALASQNDTILKLDLTFLLDRTPRENFVFRDFDLDVFNLEVEKLTFDQSVAFQKNEGLSLWNRILKKLTKRNTVIVNEQCFNYDDRHVISASDIYLNGYWQTEKYFKSIEKQIRNDFTFKDAFDDREKELAATILSQNAVCVNFRRTDYVTVKNSAETHGLTEMDYYMKAVQLMTEKVENPHFYVFSDDIEWCKRNVNFDMPTVFVDHSFKGRKFSAYLHLMTLCKHFIIPNSTFAWWAAWLNKGEEKIVIAPKRWFNEENLQNQSFDIYPDSWIKL